MRDRKTRAPGARVSWSFSAELKQSVSRMVDLCVRRGEAGDRHPVGRAADVVHSHQVSASRLSSILVLAEHRTADAARSLIGSGVNRVMLLDDPPEIIDRQVAELLLIAPRTDVRLSTRLRTSVVDGTEEVLGEIVNMSSSGLLVQTDMLFEIGERVVVSIYPGDRDDPVVAKGEVTRQALSERGGVDGVGIRFLSFAADGELRIGSVLEGAFVDFRMSSSPTPDD